MPIKFKNNKIVFNTRLGRRITFCDSHCTCGVDPNPTPCSISPGQMQSACLFIQRQDFTHCSACLTEITAGNLLPLPMRLAPNGANRWTTDDVNDIYRNSLNRQVYGDIQFINVVPCHWEVLVVCKEAGVPSTIWAGTKSTGGSPVGTYQRTAGCDLTPQIEVCG